MAFGVTSFDELNQLKGKEWKQKYIDYAEYFGDMDLTEKEKQARIKTAKRIEEEMIDVMIWMFYMYEYLTVDQIIVKILEKYTAAIERYVQIDDYLQDHILLVATSMAETTMEHKQEPYYFSEDRAQVTAENEANSVENYLDFKDAADVGGFAYKRWNTMRDKRVRETHAEVEGVVVPVNQPFVVGDSLLMFPKDTSLGAALEEIVNCRCSVKYLNQGE